MLALAVGAIVLCGCLAVALRWTHLGLGRERKQMERERNSFDVEREQHHARESELHDRLMYLAEKPWRPAPIEQAYVEPEPELVFPDFGPEATEPEWQT